MDAFWIILTASLVASSSAILGSFLILRKIALIGDAISHAVLPGIVIAFLISNSLSSITVLLGAGALGIVSAILIQFAHSKLGIQADAAMGLVFTFLFAVGVIMVASFTTNIHLDQECVLYGEIIYVPLNTITTSAGFNLGPRAVWILAITLLIVLLVLLMGWKGLKLTSFDPEYAVTLGISASFWHYTLMSLVSLSTVASFESVGAILVVAFLIVPPATAYLLVKRLRDMIMLSVALGVLSSISGYGLAAWMQSSVSGAITVMMGIIFLIVFFFSPREGIITQKLRHQKRTSLH